MDYEAIELNERAFVDERLDALASGELTTGVLFCDGIGARRCERLFALSQKLGVSLGTGLHLAPLHVSHPLSSCTG
jgi:hypothetical protein